MSETSVPEPQPQPAGFFSNLGNLYFAPTEGFTSILRRPSFWLPLILMVVMGLTFAAVWTPHLDAKEFGKLQMQESGQWDRMTAQDQEQALNIQGMVIKPMIWLMSAIGAPLYVLLVAAVLLLIFRVAMGADLGFKKSMCITAWSSFAVGLINTPLMILTMVLKGEWNVSPDQVFQPNLALLLDKAETAKGLYSLAGAVDLFSLWTIFLLAVGYGVATRRSWASALWAIVIPWALFVLGRAGIVALMS